MATKYVILGGNIAGTTAAGEIRKYDPSADITLIEREEHPLYSRVLLPHYIKDKIPREKVFMKDLKWYQDQSITFLQGVEILRIDEKNAFVSISGDREIPYDKLLICTGGDVNLMPYDVKGVTYLRSLDDAEYIKEQITRVKTLPKSEQNGVVFGGGFIALEYINAFQHFGIATTVVKRSGGFWSRILSKESQAVLADHAKAQGVTLLSHEPSDELVGADELEGFKCSSGEVIPARILGVGIGIHTERSLFEGTSLELGSGVRVNEFLETNVEGIYAAGDIAEFYDPIVGRQLQYGNWMNAQMQARTVAKTMTGERTAFGIVSSYATNLLGKEIVFIGDVSREHADDVRFIDHNDQVSVEVFDRGGQTVGAVLIGDVSKRAAITQAVKNKVLFS